jgi:hypothetical protein
MRLGGAHSRCGQVRKISPPPAIFFLCTLSVLLCPDFAFAFLPLLYNTNVQAPGGTRTRNPSKRSAAHPSLKQLGHSHRQGYDPRTVQPVASRYTDYACEAPSVYRHTSQRLRRGNYKDEKTCFRPLSPLTLIPQTLPYYIRASTTTVLVASLLN